MAPWNGPNNPTPFVTQKYTCMVMIQYTLHSADNVYQLTVAAASNQSLTQIKVVITAVER